MNANKENQLIAQQKELHLLGASGLVERVDDTTIYVAVYIDLRSEMLTADGGGGTLLL